MESGIWRAAAQGAAVAATLALLGCATPEADMVAAEPAAALSAVDYRTIVAGPAQGCEAMAGFAREDVTILWASRRPATETLPAHCEVRGVIAPAINFRLQLPDDWNGRFFMAGNGGLAGEPVDGRGGPDGDPTAEALNAGFAAVITDTGHDRREVTDASFGADPQLREDYAYRAVHESVVTGKALTRAYYAAEELVASYWVGCSTGGRQGLMSAQRFPEDFDGVVAGAPISDYTGTMITTMWTTDRAERAALSPAQFDMVADAYEAKCDVLDGLADGLVANETACAFTPSEEVALCAGIVPGDDCLTRQQTALLDEIVAGPSANGTRLHAGLPVATMRAVDPGTNPWVRSWISDTDAAPLNLGIHGSSWAYMVLDPPDPDWDWRAFDFARDPARLSELSALIDATDPNLDAFRERGGKLIMYHGAADPALVFGMSVDYRNAVAERYGAETPEFYRFLAMPGMYHCRGGYGPDTFDRLDAIVEWVEGGQAPEGLVARETREGVTQRSRPLCDYPSYARYEGGDPDDAASFSCAAP
jgi:feruloyl esterase